jgi:hypothetical protein
LEQHICAVNLYNVEGLPFGGVGVSGVDCFSGVEGLRGQCYPQAMTVDRFGFLGLRTTLPAPLNYPLKKSAPLFQSSVVKLLYSTSLYGKVRGLLDLIKITVFGSS